MSARQEWAQRPASVSELAVFLVEASSTLALPRNYCRLCPSRVTEVLRFSVWVLLSMKSRLGRPERFDVFRDDPRTSALSWFCCWQVDPFFAEGVKLCREGGQDGSDLAAHVEATFKRNTSGGV